MCARVRLVEKPIRIFNSCEVALRREKKFHWSVLWLKKNTEIFRMRASKGHIIGRNVRKINYFLFHHRRINAVTINSTVCTCHCLLMERRKCCQVAYIALTIDISNFSRGVHSFGPSFFLS